MAFANAGISETENFLEDKFDDDGSLLEPNYRLLAVNFRAVLNVVKLSYRAMKGQETGGSIVITSSATAYAPEHVLPIYSAVKSAVRHPAAATAGYQITDTVLTAFAHSS